MSDYSEMTDTYWREVRQAFLAAEAGNPHGMLRLRLLLFGPNPDSIELNHLEPGWFHRPKPQLRIVTPDGGPEGGGRAA